MHDLEGEAQSLGRSPVSVLLSLVPGQSQDTGPGWATVHGVAKSWTRLSNGNESVSTVKYIVILKMKGLIVHYLSLYSTGRLKPLEVFR